MATRQTTTLRPTFNGSLSIEARPERLSAHAGVLLLRELDQRLGLLRSLADNLHDPRDPSRVLHPLVELLRQRVFLIAAGRNHQDDSDQLRDDPACRLAVSQSRGVTPLLSPPDGFRVFGLSSQPSQSRFLDILATDGNLQALRAGLFDSSLRSIRAEGSSSRIARAILDVDSFPIEAHGHQPGSAYNGHYRCQCFHPLAVFLSNTSHFLDLDLRPGNVHTADGAVGTIVSCLDRLEEIAPTAAVRGDAGFPTEELMGALEQRDVEYAFRLRKNSKLAEIASPLLRRPAGRPPCEPRTWCHDVWYQAQSWSRPRRVVIVVEEVPGELFLRWYAIVTSWNSVVRSGEDILEFYRARGTMEAHLGELAGLDPALSSTLRPKCHVRGRAPEVRGSGRSEDEAERANAATLHLYGLAYNLLNTMRRVQARAVAPGAPIGARIRTVRLSLLVVAARVLISARRVTVVLERRTAELWRRFWRELDRLSPVPVFDSS